MDAKAKLVGHPIHQMLVVFPLGLLATSLIFDLIYLANKSGRIADASFWMISAGIIGGLAAAVFGLIDWLAIPTGTRAKAIGLWHGIGNVVVVALFLVSWSLRYNALTTAPSGPAITVSFIGIVLAVVTGWLGGELVNRMGVGVEPGAHLNSPNSMSGRPATDVDETYESAPTSASIAPGRTATTWTGREAQGLDRREPTRQTDYPPSRVSDRQQPPV
jgi:uncharacterized membrane protein